MGDHSALVKRGVALHNQFKYAKALPFLERAYQIAPKCPAVVYNLANILHMLDDEKMAASLLHDLIKTPLGILEQGCYELRAPRSFQVDAHYLLFHVLLYSGSSWKKAFWYAQKHLSLRLRGLKSAWTLQQIKRKIRDLEIEWQI